MARVDTKAQQPHSGFKVNTLSVTTQFGSSVRLHVARGNTPLTIAKQIRSMGYEIPKELEPYLANGSKLALKIGQFFELSKKVTTPKSDTKPAKWEAKSPAELQFKKLVAEASKYEKADKYAEALQLLEQAQKLNFKGKTLLVDNSAVEAFERVTKKQRAADLLKVEPKAVKIKSVATAQELARSEEPKKAEPAKVLAKEPLLAPKSAAEALANLEFAKRQLRDMRDLLPGRTDSVTVNSIRSAIKETKALVEIRTQQLDRLTAAEAAATASKKKSDLAKAAAGAKIPAAEAAFEKADAALAEANRALTAAAGKFSKLGLKGSPIAVIEDLTIQILEKQKLIKIGGRVTPVTGEIQILTEKLKLAIDFEAVAATSKAASAEYDAKMKELDALRLAAGKAK